MPLFAWALLAAIITWATTKTWWQGFLMFALVCWMFG